MNDKGNCQNCSQRIQNTTFNKCMFCGAELPEEKAFSESDIHQMKEKQKLADIEERALDEKARARTRANNSFGNSVSGDVFGGSFGDFSE